MRTTFLVLALCFSFPAFAESAEDARKALSTTLKDIKQSETRQKELSQRTEALHAELARLQENMATLGKELLRQEEALLASEEKLSILEDQKKTKQGELEKRQGELSGMLSAMVKLKEMPPEAIVAMPGKLDETLEAARALSLVTETIGEESRALKIQLRELSLLEEKIRRARAALVTRKRELTTRRAGLDAQFKARNALMEKLGGEAQAERQRNARLVAKSQDLKELLGSLQKSESIWSARTTENTAFGGHKKGTKGLRSFAKARGRMGMPAAGRIVSRYGNAEAGATFAKGIVIQTRGEADVVAPFDGEVVFAGIFRDYGRMVILRHSGDYHTLLSGMRQIECKPGQHVLEGEPIGSMGSHGDERLYMEVREDGKPVDPLDWVKG